MTHRSTRSRPGYTLLEILIASVIGLVLMAAVYAAFSIIVNDTTNGRDLTAESGLSRGLINRVGIDLGSPVGLLPPRSGGSGASGGGGSSTSDTSSSTTSATGSGTDTTATDTTSTDAATAGSAVVTGTNLPFQAGLVGTTNQLIVFLSRSPEYLRKRGATDAAITPDLVKVTYYLHSSGKGLCRQERPWVTADGVWNTTEPDRTTEDTDRIASEVVNVAFEYASGSGYVSDWDGSVADATGATNQGPPRAVRMTLTLEFTLRDGTTTTKDVSHVYPLRAAAGTGSFANTQSTDSTGTGTATTSTGGAP
ncbi:MAG: prepilin-type N-terminal cleavage/methylation domain-containing protein [Fimbriiglobus sp.]|nr:prepilin-type N-terminal cleavage/methylation domain-containing protein [Fimbriiglobus sp.]